MHLVALRSWYKTEFRCFYKKDFEQKKKKHYCNHIPEPLKHQPLRDKQARNVNPKYSLKNSPLCRDNHARIARIYVKKSYQTGST